MYKELNTSNRGKYLERAINACNAMYKLKGIALINKVPTPMMPKSRNGVIISTKYTEKSTVDFIGTLRGGQSIAFDTKECKTSSFPFKRVVQHQIEHLTTVKALGGQSFILILFTTVNELYKLDIDMFNQLSKQLTRKSIPLQWFQENLEKITSGNGVAYDYLNIKENYDE